MPPIGRDKHVLIERSKWLANVERLEVNVKESPLRELEYLGVVSAKHREAAELFEADWNLTRATRDAKDSTNVGIRGGIEPPESEGEIEGIVRAKDRVKKVKTAAGAYYPSLRHITLDRKPLKMAALVLPGLLDKVGEIYGLIGRKA
jgi:hypothetical protein